MGWSLDLGADEYGKAMTLAIRRADKVMLEAMAKSLLDLDTDFTMWEDCQQQESYKQGHN